MILWITKSILKLHFNMLGTEPGKRVEERRKKGGGKGTGRGRYEGVRLGGENSCSSG